MRRIVVWITATLAVAALAVAYQLNAAGIGGKDESGRQPGLEQEVPARPEASGSTAPDEDPAPGSTSVPDASRQNPGDPGEAVDPGDAAQGGTEHPGHEGKTGENK